MVPNESVNFEEFLLASFRDGISFRELRLSTDELAVVKEKFPTARIKKSLTSENLDGKAWYEINLLPINDQQGLAFESIQQENERLKQELEELKNSLTKVAVE